MLAAARLPCFYESVFQQPGSFLQPITLVAVGAYTYGWEWTGVNVSNVVGWVSLLLGERPW
jgi:hypothetical protein